MIWITLLLTVISVAIIAGIVFWVFGLIKNKKTL